MSRRARGHAGAPLHRAAGGTRALTPPGDGAPGRQGDAASPRPGSIPSSACSRPAPSGRLGDKETRQATRPGPSRALPVAAPLRRGAEGTRALLPPDDRAPGRQGNGPRRISPEGNGDEADAERRGKRRIASESTDLIAFSGGFTMILWPGPWPDALPRQACSRCRARRGLKAGQILGGPPFSSR